MTDTNDWLDEIKSLSVKELTVRQFHRLIDEIESLKTENAELIREKGPSAGFWGRACARQDKEIADLKRKLNE